MRVIKSGIYEILVDDDVFGSMNSYKWTISKGVALRSVKFEGKFVTIYLHREVLGLKYGDPRQGDHINGNRLDDRRENLRICSHAENLWNRGYAKNNRSGFKGVYKHLNCNKWAAEIGKNGKRFYLGLFETPELAHEFYCLAAEMLHGEFANFGATHGNVQSSG